MQGMNAPVRQGIPLRPDVNAAAREWRRSFVRDATLSTLATIRKTTVAEVSREIRSPVSPTKVGAYPGSSVSRLMLLAPRSGAAQLFEPPTVVVELRGIDSLSFFPSPSNFSGATFVGEDKPIPVLETIFTGFPVGPVKKLALIAALSRELEQASLAESIISYTLETAISKGLDAILFSAAAATADAPAGLLNGVVPLPGSASMSADLSALVAAIASNGIDTSSVVFVCAPSQALAISLLAGPHFAHRIIEAASLAAGTVIAIAVSGLVVSGDGADPAIDVSKTATLHMSTTPADIGTAGSPPTVAAPTKSMIQTDSLALRCIARITWAAAPGAVATLTGATW
jgi:hypothetical protein